MNIVIAGAGKVGHTIADRLCREGHDITLIDENRDKLDAAANAMDVLGCVGNCAAPSVLKEAEAGHHVIAGGDFNKDLLGDSAAVFGEEHQEYSWNQPIPEGTIPEGLTLVAPLDETNPVPSNRLADAPYVKGRTFVNTLDGFIVSDNVTVNDCSVIDTGFKCSDHNPVTMEFVLDEE